MLRGLLYFLLFLLIVGGALAGSWSMGWIDDEVAVVGRMARSAGTASEVSAALDDGDTRFVGTGDPATYPGTIEQVAARYGSRPASSTTSDPEAYNEQLLSSLLEVEQTLVTEIEGRLAADHLRSFEDDWSILVVSPSVKLDLQLFSLEPDLGADWWRSASRSWKLVLLHDRRRALDQELEMRETGIVTNRRHALLQQTARDIGRAVALQDNWDAVAAETP